jgi:RNA polymerase sigma-70 factor (ECF subfamily)
MMKQNQTISNEQLGEWIDLWQDSLYRYAFFKVGNRADAEDVIQDAFLRVAASGKLPLNPKAYLFRTVANLCADALRHKSHLQPIEERMPAPSLQDEAEAQEEQRRIARLLDKLQPRQAEVIRLHIHAGLKFTEIAEMLDEPATTIKSRFTSGIEKLKQMYIN